jgi:hypothetical protein
LVLLLDPGWIKIGIRDKNIPDPCNTAIFYLQDSSAVRQRAGVSRLVLLLDPGSGMDKNQDPGCLSRIRNTAIFLCGRILQRFAKEPASVGGDPEAG